MIEELFSCAILMDVDLMSNSTYGKYLDMIFMKYPTNEFLIQLEYCCTNVKETVRIIYNYVSNSGVMLDYELFGRFLFNKINEVYKSEVLNINDFAIKMCEVWRRFPSEICSIEPFHTLIYADDCLSWGDVNQTKQLYEEAFGYFNCNKG